MRTRRSDSKTGVSPAMRDRARLLRSASTEIEQSFWYQVRAGRLGGYKFRRQQPIGPYIVDFICHQSKLIIELDGSQHLASVNYDASRDDWLRSQGYRVLRIWNHQWVNQREWVMNRVWGMLEGPAVPSPRPSPQMGEGSDEAG